MEERNLDIYTLDVTLEKALYRFADKINVDIGIKNHGKENLSKEEKDRLSACSIYLHDNRRDGFVLRASTLGSPYLGKAEINLSPDHRKKFKENRLENIGLTSAAMGGMGDAHEIMRFPPVQVAFGRHVQSEGANHQFGRTSRSTEL